MSTVVDLPNGIPLIVHPERERMEQIYTLVGFWVSAFIYGVYFVLFVAASHLALGRRGKDPSSVRPQLIFGVVNVFMFVVTTFFIGVNIYRFIEAFALGAGPLGIPVLFFKSFQTWENYSYVICSSLLIWTADLLMIYRCYIVYDKNYWVVVVPFLLLLVSIATNMVNIYWFQHPLSLPFQTVRPFLDFVYPGHLAQNLLTTGLIAHKIWRQHLLSKASGLRMLGASSSSSSDNLTLLSVVRLVVESAMIYTIQLTILVVLYFMRHPAMVILQAAIVPSIGIVFVLLSIRVHWAMLVGERRKRSMNPSALSIVVPSWVHGLGAENPESSGRSSFEALNPMDLEIGKPM